MWNIDNKATHNTLMGEIERERERDKVNAHFEWKRSSTKPFQLFVFVFLSRKTRKKEVSQQQETDKTVNICEKVKQKTNAKRTVRLNFISPRPLLLLLCRFLRFGFIFVSDALTISQKLCQHKVDDIQRVNCVRLRDCVWPHLTHTWTDCDTDSLAAHLCLQVKWVRERGRQSTLEYVSSNSFSVHLCRCRSHKYAYIRYIHPDCKAKRCACYMAKLEDGKKQSQSECSAKKWADPFVFARYKCIYTLKHTHECLSRTHNSSWHDL